MKKKSYLNDGREVAARIGDIVQEVEKTYYHMFPRKKNHTVAVLNKINDKMRGDYEVNDNEA